MFYSYWEHVIMLAAFGYHSAITLLRQLCAENVAFLQSDSAPIPRFSLSELHNFADRGTH